MQSNGLSIPQTNINQEFGLTEYVPTKHSGDLLIPHCFQGLFEVAMQDCKYHKVIFWNCPLVRPRSHGSQSSHRTDPQNLKVTSYTLPINIEHQHSVITLHHKRPIRAASKHRNITSFQVYPSSKKYGPNGKITKNVWRQPFPPLLAKGSTACHRLSDCLMGLVGNGILMASCNHSEP